jgi:hypothetical protein
MVDKLKHKGHRPSGVGQFFVKRFSFCSTLTIDECVSLLRSRAKPRTGVIIAYPPRVDHDRYQFTMQHRYKLSLLLSWTPARVTVTLTRMGDETLIYARGSIGWGNVVLILWLLLVCLFYIRPFVWLIPAVTLLALGCFWMLRWRDRLCEQLVEILGPQDKT